MKIVRTILWVLLLVALLLFSIANWAPVVTVRIWEGLVVDTKIPAIVVVSFLIGFVPMWLYHSAQRWQAGRKIQTLENALRATRETPPAPPVERPAERPAESGPLFVDNGERVAPPHSGGDAPSTSRPL